MSQFSFENSGWNNPDLIRDFHAYRAGEAALTDLDILQQPLEASHVRELELGALTLLDLQPRRPEYAFTDDAIKAVRQTDAYISNPTIPKNRLFLASITRLGSGEMRFARMYSTQRTIQEALTYRELDALEQEHREQIGLPVLQPFSIQDQLRLTAGGRECEMKRETTILWPSGTEPAGGEVILSYPDGRTERRDARVQLVDYMTLGHLIQFDMNNG